MTNFVHDLEIIELRLGEAWEAFVVEKTIHKTANKEVDPTLSEKINRHGAFWNTVLLALQTTAIAGLYATVDDSSGCVSLDRVLRKVLKLKTHTNLKPFQSDIHTIRARYKPYRNNLFAHASRDRSKAIDDFNTENFSWDDLERDFHTVDHIWKVLWAANRGEKLPDKMETPHQHYGHNTAVSAAQKHVERFLQDWKGAG